MSWGRQSSDPTPSPHSCRQPMCVSRLQRLSMLISNLSEQNSNLGIRWWNLLLLQALTGNSDDVEDLLFDHFMKFALAYGAVLRPAARIPDPAASDINHAYISIKQWLLLAQRPRRRSRATPGDDVESAHTRTLLVWNELWPAFERLSRAEDPSGRSLVCVHAYL